MNNLVLAVAVAAFVSIASGISTQILQGRLAYGALDRMFNGGNETASSSSSFKVKLPDVSNNKIRELVKNFKGLQAIFKPGKGQKGVKKPPGSGSFGAPSLDGMNSTQGGGGGDLEEIKEIFGIGILAPGGQGDNSNSTKHSTTKPAWVTGLFRKKKGNNDNNDSSDSKSEEDGGKKNKLDMMTLLKQLHLYNKNKLGKKLFNYRN